MRTITEGKARIKIPKETKISKKLEVFYNPVMKFNRDMSVILLNSVSNKKMQIALPLAGSGVRGIRFLLELKKGKIKSIAFNDYKQQAFDIIMENLLSNNIISGSKNKLTTTGNAVPITLSCMDANLFLLTSTGFNYIDIDPFGTPNPYLESAINRLARNGILAVTATDTSALAGTFPNACLRKYWAKPSRNELKHELGIRILIRKVQLVGAQYEKALTPILSYSKDHYYRIFFQCEKGKTKVDQILKQHAYFQDAGPLWVGGLGKVVVVKKMLKNCQDAKLKKFLKLMLEELKVGSFGFYDIHAIAERLKLRKLPRKEELIKKIKRKKYKAASTHFSGTGIRTNMPADDFIKMLKA